MLETDAGQSAAQSIETVNPVTEVVQSTEQSEQIDTAQTEIPDKRLENLNIERVEDAQAPITHKELEFESEPKPQPSELKPSSSKAQIQTLPKPLVSKTKPDNKSQKISANQANSIPSQAGSSDITLPITHAKYLNNPHPPYPRQSRRMGEEGKVFIAVQIDVDGTAAQALVKQSSGHARLDQTALETVLKWKFVPGKKAGVPQKMWVNIPINFILE